MFPRKISLGEEVNIVQRGWTGGGGVEGAGSFQDAIVESYSAILSSVQRKLLFEQIHVPKKNISWGREGIHSSEGVDREVEGAAASRNAIVESYTAILPSVQRKLLFEQIHVPKKNISWGREGIHSSEGVDRGVGGCRGGSSF